MPEFHFAQIDGGPLLRGIQAVLQELAGSATGGAGSGMAWFGGRARFVRGKPPAAQLHWLVTVIVLK